MSVSADPAVGAAGRARVPGRPALRAVGGRGGLRAGERDALIRVAAAAADAYRLEDVMEQAADAAREAIGAASLSISRWERDIDAMRTLINVGELGPGEERFPAQELYPLADFPLVARLLREATPYRNVAGEPQADAASARVLHQLGKGSNVGVPIVLDDAVWGEVWATTAPGGDPFDAADVSFLQAIADRLALVLARGERFARVSRLAYEDPLTGLANRRAIEERLDRLLAERTDADPPLTLLIADVDELKDVNDAHGHHVGDRALCRVGEALVAAAAPETAALVGRLSGDEFCVLLEGCMIDSASAVVSAALELLAAGPDLPLSLSFGAAAATPGVTPAAMLRAADAAQYVAKRRGGGRLCTGDPSLAVAPTRADRRQGRPRGGHDLLERAAAELLDELDDRLGHARVLDRIEAVVVGLAAPLNAAAWAISRWERGSGVLRSVSTADDRDQRLRGLRLGLENEVYHVEEFPRTAELLTAGTGAYVARADDADTDPGERRLLVELGLGTVLVATAGHGSGAYLVEIYGDDRTAPLEPASLRLALLLRVATAPRPAS